MKKRVLSLFLALTLCLTLLPTAAFAEGTNGSAISSEAAAAEGGQPTATGAPTEGGGQLTNTGEGEQPNSETDALTEIWCVSKPDSIGRSYDGTTNGSTIPIDLTFTDGTNSIILKEGTDFTAKKTFDSADAGDHTVTVELELIGDAATKYKLRAGEETFTIRGTINKAYPDLTVSLTKTTCTVGEKLLPLLFISGVQEDAAVTYYYTQYQTIVGNSEYEDNGVIPAIDKNTAVSSLDEEGNNTYYVYAKTGETRNYNENISNVVELTVNEAAVEAASITRADGTDGGTYGSLPAALNAAQNGDTVTMLTTLNDDDTISFCRDAEGEPVEKTVTLMMNGQSLSFEGASPLHIQSGKLIIGDDAAISQPAQAAVPAVFVDNNEQSKDRGTLEFKGKATLTGGLLIQNWGKLVGGLKEGTIITSNGTYSVSVERSIDTYSNVLGLLGEGLAFAKKDKPTELVNGNVKNLTEDVIVVAHTHSPKCTQNPDPDALQTYIYTCDCGFVCPHDRFTNSICDICHAACTHDEYTSDDKCARCGAPFAVRVECTDSVGITSNKLYMKTTTQDGTDDTLRQVFNEAADGSTITLLANGMLPYGIYASKTLTLDLNGHSLSGFSLNVGGSTATGQTRTGNLTVIDSRGGNGAVGVTVRDGGTLVFDPENDSTTLLQLEVWGGKVELHGGKILRKDLRLNNSITLGNLLPQKAGLAYYCGDTQLTLKEAASKTCDLVVKSCAHGGKNGFDKTATACPYCNVPAVAETALNNGEGSRLLRRFANLQTALDADRDGGATLRLLTDVTGDYTIDGTRDTGLDLNGHCIKGTVTVKAAAGSNTTTFSNTQNTTSVSIDAVVAHRGAKLAGSKYPAVIGVLTLAEGATWKNILNLKTLGYKVLNADGTHKWYAPDDVNDSQLNSVIINSLPITSKTLNLKVTPKDGNAYTEVTGTATVKVDKAQQYGKVSMKFYIYGETPSTPSLTDRTGDAKAQVTYYYNTTNSNSGGTKWENIQPDTLSAGTRYYMYAELGETENYESFTTDCVKFWVMKAIPTCTEPTGLTAKYGQKLDQIALPNPEGNTPGTWRWQEPETVLDQLGTRSFYADFKPDNETYSEVLNVAIDVTVGPADGGSLKTVELAQKYTDASVHTYKPDWSGLPGGQTWRYNSEYSVSTGSNVTLTKQDFAADGSLLTYAISGGKAGDKITLTLKASCDNYKDFTITLNITLTEKDDQKPLTITGNTSVIYGEKLTLTTSGGNGTGAVTYRIDTAHSTGEAAIDPNTGVLTPVRIGSVSVIAAKAGDNDYNDVTSAPFVLMIKPATPTGEPNYTKITTGGKTLKDAALTTKGSTLNPNDGKLEWLDDKGNALPDDTRVKVNTTYKWRFTPTDTNYTTLTGEIELLYHKSNGGGSSGYSYYTIEATAGAGGSISPSGSVSVREGGDQTFTITPDKGYAVSNVKIDGKSIGAVKSYTFENVSRTHTIEVIFVKGTASARTGDGSDLPLWSALLLASTLTLAGAVHYKRKRAR